MDYLTYMELTEIRKIMEDVRDELRKMNEYNFCPNCGAKMSASYRQVTGKLNSEIEKSKSEIVPDYRDGCRLREGEEQ